MCKNRLTVWAAVAAGVAADVAPGFPPARPAEPSFPVRVIHLGLGRQLDAFRWLLEH